MTKRNIVSEIEEGIRQLKLSDRRKRDSAKRRRQYIAQADRIREFMFLPSLALGALAKSPGATLERKTTLDMEIRRRVADSRRSERNGRGSCRWGTEDVRNHFEEFRDRGIEV